MATNLTFLLPAFSHIHIHNYILNKNFTYIFVTPCYTVKTVAHFFTPFGVGARGIGPLLATPVKIGQWEESHSLQKSCDTPIRRMTEFIQMTICSKLIATNEVNKNRENTAISALMTRLGIHARRHQAYNQWRIQKYLDCAENTSSV